MLQSSVPHSRISQKLPKLKGPLLYSRPAKSACLVYVAKMLGGAGGGTERTQASGQDHSSSSSSTDTSHGWINPLTSYNLL